MSGNRNKTNNPSEERRRNPSRPGKNTVSDIKEVFKKQMAANSNSNSNSNSTPNIKRNNKQVANNSNTKKAKPTPIEECEEDSEITKDNTISASTSQESLNLNHAEKIEQSSQLSHQESSEDESLKSDNEDNGDNEDNDNEEVYNSARDLTDEDEATSQRGDNADKQRHKKNTPQQTVSVQTPQDNQSILSNLVEIKETLNKLCDAIFDPKNGIEVQLGKTITRVDTLYSDIHGAVNGLKVRMDKAEEVTAKVQIMEENIKRISQMLDDNKRLTQELKLMQGLIQKCAQQSQATKSQVLDLTKRGMEQNLVIHGLDEVPDPKETEDCKHSIIQFIYDKMNITLDKSQIWKAHRIGGARRRGIVRPVVAKFSYDAKELITQNFSNLKGQCNATTGKPLFISEQIPEGITETKKQVQSRLKVLRTENDKREPDRKHTITVQNDKIIVNGKLDKPEVQPPQPSDLFMDIVRQKQVSTINKQFVMTETANVKNSQFIGLAIRVDSIQQVNNAYRAAAQRFPAADHIMVAYALKENDVFKCGNCDDGEYGGSACIRKVMVAEKPKDTAIFVVRRYGGLHLGTERFKAIEKIATEALHMIQ